MDFVWLGRLLSVRNPSSEAHSSLAGLLGVELEPLETPVALCWAGFVAAAATISAAKAPPVTGDPSSVANFAIVDRNTFGTELSTVLAQT